MNFKKLIKTTTLCLLCALSLTACSKKEPELNADRPTDTAYDFINLINVSVYGSEGNGFIEITPKDVSVEDFASEQDYIEVRKVMDSLGLYVGPDKQRASYLAVEPNGNLKNGDIVTIGIKEGWNPEQMNISMNITPFQMKIETLQPGKPLNLFDESSIQFYGLSGTKSVYAYKMNGGSVPVDILNNMNYTIQTTDSELRPNKTILSVSAQMDQSYLEEGENPAFTTETYLGRQGYLAELNAEKVLTAVVDPLQPSEIDQSRFAQAIVNYLTEDEIILSGVEATFDSLINIRQSNKMDGTDPFTYTVNFFVNLNGAQQCATVKLRIVDLNNSYIVAEKMGSYGAVGTDVCMSEDRNATTIFNFVNNTEATEMPDLSNEENKVVVPVETEGAPTETETPIEENSETVQVVEGEE